MSPFKSLKTVTIHTLDGEEVLAALQSVHKHKLDPVGNGEVIGGDSSGHMTLRITGVNSEDDKEEYDMFKTKGPDVESSTPTILQAFLNIECAAGRIPAGTYHVRFSWG